MISGLLIGIGVVLPGVSGGVIALILGVYDKLIFSINNFKEDKKNNLIFLIKIIVGIILGAIISSKMLKYFFSRYFIEMSYLFIGLVLGTIPMLLKDYYKKCSDKINYYVLVVVMLLSAFFSYFIKDNIIISKDSTFILFLAGFLFAIGKIVPGISSSVLLSLIGKYDMFLNIMSNPIEYIYNNFDNFIIVIFGFIVGLLVSLKLISYFLKKYYSLSNSIIFGFVIGSLSALYPNVVTFSGIVIMLIGIVLSLGIPLIKYSKI